MYYPSNKVKLLDTIFDKYPAQDGDIPFTSIPNLDQVYCPLKNHVTQYYMVDEVHVFH